MAAVRYIVHDIDDSIVFYRDSLGFAVKMKADGFAGAGGRQILVEDPSGNVVELFERAGTR